MKRSMSINVSRMLKLVPHFVLAPVAAAVLSACGDATPEPEKFMSNVDECSGMNTRAEVTSCEAAYYKAVVKAEKELPRFSTLAECEKIYGTCGRPAGSSNDSVLVPMMAGYIAAQMVNDLGDGFRSRSHYYQDQERRKRDREFDAWYVQTQGGTVNTSQYKRPSPQPKPNVAPPPKKSEPVKTQDRGGWGSSGSAKKNWGSSGGSWGG